MSTAVVNVKANVKANGKANVTEIYTDGACSGNPGPGGWGTLIEFSDGQVHELGGRDKATTNNRMEMQAAIAALEFLQEGDVASGSVILHTDSEYLKNGITKWIKGWKRKGWKTSAGKPVLNQDLWQQLDLLTDALSSQKLSIDWRYVRGHAGNPGNERCDAIARAFTHSSSISLKQYKALKAEAAATSPAEPPAELLSAKIANSVALSEEIASIASESEAIDANSHRENPQSIPEINTDTTQVPSPTAALKSYEIDPQEGQQPDMVTPSEKQGDSQETSRIERLTNALKTLQVTDELAKQGYLITSAELADLMDVNASAVTSRGDYWAWRNWTVSRIRREGNQILWQLERIDE